MNDIDRSVDNFDFAMRRRFRFVELRADERLEMLANLEDEELEAEAIRRMSALNREIADRQFDFGFAVDWMRKDLGLCLDQVRRSGVTLPVTALVDQFYGDVQALGGNRWDTSAKIGRASCRERV